MAILNNIEALTKAIEQSMEKDDQIVIFGEDVGLEGGVFRATAGLQAKFGEERVWNAVLAEAVISGAAVGMALAGMKPIVEMQFQGFMFPGYHQLIVHAARYRNRSRGRFTVPMVFRMPMGGGIRALEHHSEALEILFAHIPGLKVVMPATPYDTKGLMVAAINCPDPVVFLEPKKLYRSFKQEIPDEMYEVEIGKANVLIEGTDMTLVTYGSQVHDSLEAVQKMQAEGKSVELIDLRTIRPLDMATIIKSVQKTGRLLVVHEAVKSFSVSAEIIANVNEKAFLSLECPPARLTGWDITVPLDKGEKYHMITPERVEAKIREVLAYEI